LADKSSFESLKIELEQVSKDGTRKYLLRTVDGEYIEAVFMSYDYGNSLCISTQVGCNMGCKFCASTIGGKHRDLKAWEMLDEFLVIRKAAESDINHIVLMGMGEPFDNYEEVSDFLQTIHDPNGINLSYRNITVSTCGLVPMIKRFGEDFPQVNLAISLHAANQEAREKIMPIAKKYSLDQLMAACKEHEEKTGRRISYEYTLILGKNDREEDAKALASLLKGQLCHVNLIPLNAVEETGLAGSSREAAQGFANRLEKLGIPATVRRELGSDIDAACGQLRKKQV
ncbi:MAG: 23S rRNA (adenine(2503)-C(2))-methyltransferase RlmN, partial [Bacillota bacterium]|nr:23S rRNA (adenine(2503)-C(2))-methyltransferase RlmN [Bacillota bacterium]